MSETETHELESAVLRTVLAGEDFWPEEPRSLEETGLSEPFVEGLLLKHLSAAGTVSGRGLTDRLGLPHAVLEPFFSSLRGRQLIVHAGSAAFNDYYFTLTESGRQQAQSHMRTCSYVGPAPVPLMDYVIAVEAQAIRSEPVHREKFETGL